MVDKIRPLKIETLTDGSSNDLAPKGANPNQDYVACKGVAFENNDNQLIDVDGNGNLQATDIGGTSALVTESKHNGLNQLVHNVAETSYTEALPAASAQPTSITTWTDNLKTTKIRECLISYASGLASQVITKQYDNAGALLQTLTQTPAYSGGLVTSIDAVLS